MIYPLPPRFRLVSLFVTALFLQLAAPLRAQQPLYRIDGDSVLRSARHLPAYFAFTVAPLSLLGETPRYRAGLLYGRNRWSFATDLELGSSRTPMPRIIRQLNPYRFAGGRAEVRYRISSKPGVHNRGLMGTFVAAEVSYGRTWRDIRNGDY